MIDISEPTKQQDDCHENSRNGVHRQPWHRIVFLAREFVKQGRIVAREEKNDGTIGGGGREWNVCSAISRLPSDDHRVCHPFPRSAFIFNRDSLDESMHTHRRPTVGCYFDSFVPTWPSCYENRSPWSLSHTPLFPYTLVGASELSRYSVWP